MKYYLRDKIWLWIFWPWHRGRSCPQWRWCWRDTSHGEGDSWGIARPSPVSEWLLLTQNTALHHCSDSSVQYSWKVSCKKIRQHGLSEAGTVSHLKISKRWFTSALNSLELYALLKMLTLLMNRASDKSGKMLFASPRNAAFTAKNSSSRPSVSSKRILITTS